MAGTFLYLFRVSAEARLEFDHMEMPCAASSGGFKAPELCRPTRLWLSLCMPMLTLHMASADGTQVCRHWASDSCPQDTQAMGAAA